MNNINTLRPYYATKLLMLQNQNVSMCKYAAEATQPVQAPEVDTTDQEVQTTTNDTGKAWDINNITDRTLGKYDSKGKAIYSPSFMANFGPALGLALPAAGVAGLLGGGKLGAGTLAGLLGLGGLYSYARNNGWKGFDFLNQGAAAFNNALYTSTKSKESGDGVDPLNWMYSLTQPSVPKPDNSKPASVPESKP